MNEVSTVIVLDWPSIFRAIPISLLILAGGHFGFWMMTRNPDKSFQEIYRSIHDAEEALRVLENDNS